MPESDVIVELCNTGHSLSCKYTKYNIRNNEMNKKSAYIPCLSLARDILGSTGDKQTVIISQVEKEQITVADTGFP